ncbi:MAG: glycosyltransferase family 39 protein [Anaerolineales bacterium]
MKREALSIRWIHIGILLVLILTMMPRVLNLSARAIGNDEAINALNATELTPHPASRWPGENISLSTSPLYEWITGLVFQLTGSGEAQARFVPAIAGIILALLPIFFIGEISRVELLLSSAILALSPVAINLSRTAGGYTLSALFLTASFLVAFVPLRSEGSTNRWILSSIFLGAGIASGTAFYLGLCSLGLAYLLVSWRFPAVAGSANIQNSLRGIVRYIWLAPLVGVLLATGVGGYRFGLAGMGESIVLWLRGWVPFGQLSALGFILAGFAYEPFILIMGGIGTFHAWRTGEVTGKVFSIWALSSLLIALIYPGRSAQDWIWVVIPLSYLAAKAVKTLIDRLSQRESWIHVASLVAVALILISAALVTLLGYVNGYLQQMLIGDDALIGLALLAMLLLLSSVFVLFGLGWSWDIVQDGGGIVVVILTMLLSISAAWNLAKDQGLGFRTLWVASSPTENGKYFQATLENASLALTGIETAAPVQVQGDVDPSIIWRLRQYPAYKPTLDEDARTPPIIIVPEGADLGSMGAEYFGQGFALNTERAWFGLVPPDLLRWSLTHSAPSASTGWVVFIRGDIIAVGDFPDEGVSE